MAKRGGSGRDGEGLAVVLGAKREEERGGHLGECVRLAGGVRPTAEAALQHLGVHHTGAERHAGHAAGQLVCHRLAESLDGPLGGAVGRNVGGGAATPAGAEVDDHAVVALDHRRGKVPGDIGHALDIDVDDGVELRHRHIDEWAIAVDDCRVVNQQVRCAVGLKRFAGPVSDERIIGDVDRGQVMLRAKRVLEFADLIRRAAAADDLVAQPVKLLDQSAADAAGDSGDDDRLGQARDGLGLGIDRSQLDVADF